MHGERDRDYTLRHQKIVDKLTELWQDTSCACFSVPKLAAELGMDQRTVRAHLRIIEIDNAGVFLDPEQKEFCTREGLIRLAERLGMEIRTDGG